MATVRKRKLQSGEIRWQADYTDAKGKRRSRQFEKRKDADAYLVTVRSDLQRGVHVAPNASITVKEAGALWLQRAERDRLVRSTVRQYQAHLQHHIEPALGRIKLSDLTTPRLHEFIDGFLATHSRALARKVLTSIGSIIDEAIRRGVASHNPARAVKLRVTHDEGKEGDDIEMPSKGELKAMLAAVTGRWRPIIVTAIFTGMRGSELRALLWEDVDLKANIIKVRRRVDSWGTFGAPKTKAGKRDIPLPPMVSNTLREWKMACPKGEANKLDLVFPAPSGGVLSHSCILKDGFQPLQSAAGLPAPKYGLHALRHAAVSLWIEQGLQPKRIQMLAGHSSIRVTFDIYGHLFRSDAEDQTAMAEIEARLLR
jgi:integrase